jgi:hypothetical protein
VVDDPDMRAAIVCVHVHADRLPILYAAWDPPDEPIDSGWQFLCSGDVDHESLGPEGARLWAVEEVLNREPTLRGLLAASRLRRCTRSAPGQPWRTVSPQDA